MGMSGGKPAKVKESKAELEQAQRAQARLEEWRSDGFKDLETDAIRDARVDLTEALERRGNADAVQSIAPDDAGRQIALSQGNMGKQIFSENLGLDSAIREVDRNSRIEAQNLKDQKMIGMAKVGQNVAASVDNAFTNAASRGASRAQTRAASQAAMRNERLNRIVQVGGAAVQGYIMGGGGAAKPQVASASPSAVQPKLVTNPKVSTGNGSMPLGMNY